MYDGKTTAFDIFKLLRAIGRLKILSIRIIKIMPIWLKAAGKWGSIFAILALVVTLLKQIIAFIGFLTFAIKVLVILVFVALIGAVGFMIVRSWNTNRQAKN